MRVKVSLSREYSSSTWTPLTPISDTSSVNTPGSDSIVHQPDMLSRRQARPRDAPAGASKLEGSKRCHSLA